MREVLVVTPTFFPEPVGTPLYVTDMVEWLGEHAWNVQVVTAQPFYPEFKRYSGYGRGKRNDGVGSASVYRLPTIVPKKGKARWRALNELNFLAQGSLTAYRGTIQQRQFVISVSAGTPSTMILGRILTATGGHHIVLVHDILSGLAAELRMANQMFLRAIRRIEQMALDQADQVHVLSSQMARSVHALGVSTPVHINPIWATVNQPPKGSLLGPFVQYSGTLGRKHGVVQLIELASELQSHLPNERMLVRGSGPMLRVLTHLRARNRLENLDLEPLVPRQHLAEALGTSPIHVVPQEPGCADYVLPSKVINALAVGAVVVAAAPTGSALHDLSQSTAAVIAVPPGDVSAMSRAVVKLSDDRAHLKRLQNLAMEFARSAFDRSAGMRAITSSLLQPQNQASDNSS